MGSPAYPGLLMRFGRESAQVVEIMVFEQIGPDPTSTSVGVAVAIRRGQRSSEILDAIPHECLQQETRE
jgi:hypothetical protein